MDLGEGGWENFCLSQQGADGASISSYPGIGLWSADLCGQGVLAEKRCLASLCGFQHIQFLCGVTGERIVLFSAVAAIVLSHGSLR